MCAMLKPLPETVHLRATNRQYLVLASASALLAGLLAFTNWTGNGPAEEISVWLTVFFSMTTLVGVCAALFRHGWLTLDRDGFESSEFKSLGKIGWSEVSEFSLHYSGGKGMPASRQVAFKLTEEKRKALPRLSGILMYGRVRLTEPYKVRGSQLVTLMNRFRERALVTSGASEAA